MNHAAPSPVVQCVLSADIAPAPMSQHFVPNSPVIDDVAPAAATDVPGMKFFVPASQFPAASAATASADVPTTPSQTEAVEQMIQAAAFSRICTKHLNDSEEATHNVITVPAVCMHDELVIDQKLPRIRS